MSYGIQTCYDPVAQEDRRQAKVDEFMNGLPHCVICGSAIFPGAKYHEAFRKPVCKPVCNYCFEELEANVEYVDE